MKRHVVLRLGTCAATAIRESIIVCAVESRAFQVHPAIVVTSGTSKWLMSRFRFELLANV